MAASDRPHPPPDRLIRLLVDSAPDGILTVDPGARCTFVNQAGERMLGMPAADIVGADLRSIVHRGLSEGAPSAGEWPLYQAVLGGGECRGGDLITRADGGVLPVSWATWPIVDRGRLLGAVVTLRDLAAQPRGEDGLADLLSHLVVLTAKLTRLLPLDELVRVIGDSALRLSRAAGAAIYLPQAGDGVRAAWTSGVSADYVSAVESGGTAFPTRLMAATPGPLRVGRLDTEGVAPELYVNPEAMPQQVRDHAVPAGIQALAVWPLVHGARPIGTVGCYFRVPKDWSPAEQEVFHAFCGQAAIAVENARLHEDQVHLALTDSLTGLPNRRALQQALERELARAARTKDPLSVLFVDVDHFKTVNDTHGHAAGDEALRTIAGTLHSSCRSMDLAARYGGDEFIIILPETGKAGAVRVAQRIRERISRLPAKDTGGARLRVSIGIACTTETETAPAALLGAADRALYGVKRAGGNGIGGTD